MLVSFNCMSSVVFNQPPCHRYTHRDLESTRHVGKSLRKRNFIFKQFFTEVTAISLTYVTQWIHSFTPSKMGNKQEHTNHKQCFITSFDVFHWLGSVPPSRTECFAPIDTNYIHHTTIIYQYYLTEHIMYIIIVFQNSERSEIWGKVLVDSDSIMHQHLMPIETLNTNETNSWTYMVVYKSESLRSPNKISKVADNCMTYL